MLLDWTSETLHVCCCDMLPKLLLLQSALDVFYFENTAPGMRDQSRFNGDRKMTECFIDLDESVQSSYTH